MLPDIHVKVPVEGQEEPEDGPLEDVGDRMIGTGAHPFSPSSGRARIAALALHCD